MSPELKPGKYTLGMELTGQSAGQHGESVGTTRLYVNGNVVAEGPMKTQPGKFTLSGDGLCIGRDSGDNVSQDCKAPGECKGGTILALGSVSASSSISISRGWPQHCSPPSKTGDRAVGDGSFPMRALGALWICVMRRSRATAARRIE